MTPPTHHANDDHEAHPGPLARLVTLLRPEFGEFAVVSLFALVVSILALATPIAIEALVNTVAFGRYLQPVLWLSLILFTFLGFAAALRATQTYAAEILQRRLFVRVVAQLVDRLPRVRQNAFDSLHGPELMNRFFDVATVQKTAATLVLDGVAIVVQGAVGMIVLAFYHPWLVGFDLVLVGLMAFAVFVLGWGAVGTSIRESYAKYAVAGWLEQLAAFHATFKSPGGAGHAVLRADDLTTEYLNARKAHFQILFRQILFALFTQAIAATALLGLGGWLVINGQLTLGQLVAAELIVSVIVGSFAKLGKHMESWYDLAAAVDKLGHLFDLPVEREAGESLSRNGRGVDVKLHDASYAFQSSGAGVTAVDLHFTPNSCVALMGPPGSGKSSLLDMLYGMRDSTHGWIEYDGCDVRSLSPESIRAHVTLVRGPEVFEGSVADNLRMSREGLSTADLRDTLEIVALWDEMLRLPQGIDTPLVSGGSPLSGSQISRLTLARGLLGDPRLLLIDGALDNLSDELAASILAAIRSRRPRCTILLVTGRRELADVCDRVEWIGTPGGDTHIPREPSLAH